MFRLARTALRTMAAASTAKPPQMFDKILIANRGEIACRVVKTARKLGVKTVAVYSDADANSMHVKMADEAVHIGGSASTESYLKMDKIIEVAHSSKAQAIHPGYGFLSENAIFAERCEKEGIVFIGPPASAIRAMGSKSASKDIMLNAGVPLIKGYHGDEQSNEFLQQKAAEIGFPVLIKAVLGGGGKGMRIVYNPNDFLSDLESARAEAIKSFSDSRVLIEKYVERPRHVEVQVFADTFGDAVYLYERDCSVQRRHQKIIEESPAPRLSDELRRYLGETAVKAAKAVNYVGAGTVEFLFDTSNDEYYFMEMNTRLQVEHPVTEMVTQTDLVEWQLLVASGFRLPRQQHEIKPVGHAFEARIYAENPARNFIPGAGTLTYLRTPRARDDLRIETGIEQGDAVSVFYDPMISKLVVWGADRRTALAKLDSALAEYNICGLHTNIDFLRVLANHSFFRDGLVSTKFIEEHRESLFPIHHPLKNKRAVAQAVLAVLLNETKRTTNLPNAKTDPTSPWAVPFGVRINDKLVRHITLQTAEKESLKVAIEYQGNGSYHLTWPGQKPVVVKGYFNEDGKLCAYVDDQFVKLNVAILADHVTLFTADGSIEFSLSSPEYLKAFEKGSGDVVSSPTTGTIEEVMVQPGTAVLKNQPLVKMESMKMLQILRAPRDGVVARVNVGKGDFVNEASIVVELTPESE